MTITLYELQPSPHARKVRLLAAELGIPLNKVPVDPRIGETRTKEYLAMNPNGRVPTLEEDGFVLWESPAILKYLSAKRPERGLCGGDPKTQALIDQWICWWVGGAEAAIDTLAWEKLIKPKVLNQPGNDGMGVHGKTFQRDDRHRVHRLPRVRSAVRLRRSVRGDGRQGAGAHVLRGAAEIRDRALGSFEARRDALSTSG